MTKKLLILFLLSVGITHNYAQTEIDSLRAVLKSNLPDTSRVNTYLHFYHTDLFYDQPDEVIAFSYKALDLSRKIRFETGEIIANDHLGYMHRIRGHKDSALYHYREAAAISERIKFTEGIIDALLGMGNTYSRIQLHDSAQVQFNRALEIAKLAGDSIKMASVYNDAGNAYMAQNKLVQALENYQFATTHGDSSTREVAYINIGLVHIRLGNYEEARYYSQKGLELSLKIGNEYNALYSYQNLGIIEKKLGNYDKALGYYSQAAAGFKKIGDNHALAEIITNLGNIHFEQKSFNLAIERYEESLNIYRDIKNDLGVCFNLIAIGLSYRELKNYESAEKVLLDASQLADSLQFLTQKMDVSLGLSQVYKNMGNFQKALAYHVKFKALNDSVLSLQNESQINEMEAKYQAAEKERKIELLSAENQIANLSIQKQTNFRNFLIVMAFILSVLAALAYNRFQVKARANKKLKELDEIKTSFFTNISHEFRTPLTLIISPVQKLLEETDSKPFRSELTTIYKSANRLLELTNELLDLSKLEAGKLTLHLVKSDIVAFIKVVAASFESIAAEKGIVFECSFKEPQLEVYFDADKLQKIVNNLLSNAFKFTPSGGQVRMSLTVNMDSVSVEISDNGPGLTEKEQLLIFDRFYQGDTSNSYAPGTGIGLTLTNELVALHHGSLMVKSKKGEGASFTFSLPRNKSAYSKAEFESTERITKTSQDMPNPLESDEIEENVEQENVPLVLLVEDNSALRKHLGDLLKDDYRIEESVNGHQGIDKALKTIPDIIISDLMMPETDGLTLCKTLKMDERTSHIPIIILTAKADMSAKLEGLEHGADDYLVKPFHNAELKIRVVNLIQQRISLRSRYATELLLQPSKVSLSNPDEIFIKKAMNLVDKHLSDSDFTVEIFQREMAMSRMQLHRKLKALTNFSASEFVRDFRLQRAAELLSNNGINVAEAGYSCGFNSLSYFTQCFKKKYGVNPSKYSLTK